MYLIFYLRTLKLGGLVVGNLSKAIFEINAIDYCSMNCVIMIFFCSAPGRKYVHCYSISCSLWCY